MLADTYTSTKSNPVHDKMKIKEINYLIYAFSLGVNCVFGWVTPLPTYICFSWDDEGWHAFAS